MTSASPRQSHPAPPAGPLRWTLKPPSATPTGSVDGAWWPRSRDLAAELPALLAALEQRLGPVEQVSHHLGDWDDAPRRLSAAGTTVRIGGYRHQAADTVDVSGATQRVTLLVVPPGAGAGPAERALTAAGRADDTDRVAALLGDARERHDAAARATA